MLGPKVIEVVESPINGRLEVRKWGKDIYITTAGLTQSGGLIQELWEKTLKKLKLRDINHKSWLILGMATGTAAKIISTRYSPSRTVGIELDPEMIRVGHKYFDLDKISHLEIIMADAKKYVFQTKEKFDFVIVDLYIGDKLPVFVYQKRFLEQLGNLGKLVILNHLFYDPDKKARAEKLVSSLKPLYPHIQLVRELTNLLIICS